MSWPRYLLGMLATIGVLVLAASLDGGPVPLRMLFSPPATLIVIVGSTVLLLATFPVQQLLGGVRTAMRRPDETTPEERALALVVLSAAMRYPCGLGAISCLIGFIDMLRNLQDPAQVGPAMAFSFLGALFAVFLSEVLVAPLWFRIATAPGGATPSPVAVKPPAPLAPIVVVLLCMLTMLTLLAALGHTHK